MNPESSLGEVGFGRRPLLSANYDRASGFASEAQASWMIFPSRRFEKLDYPIEE